MILGFSTHWPKSMGELAGEKTDFIPKIWKGIFKKNAHPLTEFHVTNDFYLRTGLGFLNSGILDLTQMNPNVKPKIHTIREDPHNRWKPGMKIHPAIGVRTKKYFQFAPLLECKSVQKIEIVPDDGDFVVYIDCQLYGEFLSSGQINNTYPDGLENLALNDGFDNVEHFFRWFNKDFTGKIIHWTDKIY